LLAAICAGALVVHGQEAQPPVFRSGVRVVRVDVSVTGKGDRPITDLAAADFTLDEDGIRQTVDTAQFLQLDGHRVGDTDSLSIRSQDHAEAEAQRDDVRLFAIFLDDYHIDRRPPVMVPLRKALLSFIDRLGPADLAAWMDPLTPLSALRFTRDYEEIKAVVRKFEGRQGEIFPIKSVMEEEQLTSRNPRMLRAQVTLSALAALVTRLGNLREGRKNVIFVSQGPATMFGFDGDAEDDMKEVLQAANRGNVTINVFDPRGLAGEGVGARETLLRLAAETGGRQIINTNGFEQGLGKIIGDASAYYLLGYTPTRSDDDGKFHKISVKVKRPGVDVLARKGYWAPDPKDVATATAVADTPATPGLTEALTPMAVSRTGRAADVWVGVTSGASGRPRLLVTWEAPARSAAAGSAAVTRVDVERVAMPEGTVIGESQSIESASGARVQGGVAELDVDPGEHTLRFTARVDNDSTADRWTQKIDVPDPRSAPLLLGTPILRRARSPLEFRTIRQNPGTAPTASRAFRRSDRVLVEVACFGALSSDASLGIDLLNRTGQVLVSLPVPAPLEGRIQFELPVGSLVHSTYVIRVAATVGQHRAERLEAFEVVP
jgi:VWFA-related protein